MSSFLILQQQNNNELSLDKDKFETIVVFFSSICLTTFYI